MSLLCDTSINNSRLLAGYAKIDICSPTLVNPVAAPTAALTPKIIGTTLEAACTTVVKPYMRVIHSFIQP